MPTEVLVAIIGLLGVVVGALFANWDKVFGKNNKVVLEVEGYKPTGNYETELRHYFNVSGSRATAENTVTQMLNSMMLKAIESDPADAQEIRVAFEVVARESMRIDDMISALMPVYRKYLDIKELQSLNRFYSSKEMQQMVNKLPLLVAESMPIQMQILAENQQRVQVMLEHHLSAINPELPQLVQDEPVTAPD